MFKVVKLAFLHFSVCQYLGSLQCIMLYYNVGRRKEAMWPGTCHEGWKTRIQSHEMWPLSISGPALPSPVDGEYWGDMSSWGLLFREIITHTQHLQAKSKGNMWCGAVVESGNRAFLGAEPGQKPEKCKVFRSMSGSASEVMESLRCVGFVLDELKTAETISFGF